mmetsp:Transcript_32916/g.98040  ORF Transcript_32916/g.98040 Transcript_32916/m.98040 type:complete len:221 (-) Transcript_32916:460-1122(-)
MPFRAFWDRGQRHLTIPQLCQHRPREDSIIPLLKNYLDLLLEPYQVKILAADDFPDICRRLKSNPSRSSSGIFGVALDQNGFQAIADAVTLFKVFRNELFIRFEVLRFDMQRIPSLILGANDLVLKSGPEKTKALLVPKGVHHVLIIFREERALRQGFIDSTVLFFGFATFHRFLAVVGITVPPWYFPWHCVASCVAAEQSVPNRFEVRQHQLPLICGKF